MNWRWIFLMAWRDSRKNRSRLFLFISSIILGIASLVSMNSFNRNLKVDIDNQAAELIGADLALESNRKPTEEALAFIDSLKEVSLGFAKEELKARICGEEYKDLEDEYDINLKTNPWETEPDFLEFVDVDEIGIVEEYIKEHNVRPYFVDKD